MMAMLRRFMAGVKNQSRAAIGPAYVENIVIPFVRATRELCACVLPRRARPWVRGAARRSGALFDSGRERAPGTVRLSALRPGIRHVQSCLSADERRAGLHAAARPPSDRGLHAASVEGAVRRREYSPDKRRRLAMGRCGDG